VERCPSFSTGNRNSISPVLRPGRRVNSVPMSWDYPVGRFHSFPSLGRMISFPHSAYLCDIFSPPETSFLPFFGPLSSNHQTVPQLRSVAKFRPSVRRVATPHLSHPANLRLPARGKVRLPRLSGGPSDNPLFFRARKAPLFTGSQPPALSTRSRSLGRSQKAPTF